MEETENLWVQQARGGDQVAFSKLVEAYQKPVYNLAYRLLGNPAEAEDAAQETFIRAYTRLDTYDASRKFSSWMLSIASHYCIDMLRRRRGVALSIEDLPPMIDVSMPKVKQPENVVIQDQITDEIQELLETLPTSYRTPVILRYWYDMSYQEIADAMGVAESTIKTRLHRARLRLAEVVQETHQHLLEGQLYEQAAM